MTPVRRIDGHIWKWATLPGPCSIASHTHRAGRSARHGSEYRWRMADANAWLVRLVSALLGAAMSHSEDGDADLSFSSSSMSRSRTASGVSIGDRLKMASSMAADSLRCRCGTGPCSPYSDHMPSTLLGNECRCCLLLAATPLPLSTA